MNLPKFPHSAMFVVVTACVKTKFLLKLLETIYKTILNSSQFYAQQSQTIRHTFLGNGFLMIRTFLSCVTLKGNYGSNYLKTH